MTGTVALVRLALRRDRILLPIWIFVIAGASPAPPSAIGELYPGRHNGRPGRHHRLEPRVAGVTGPVFDATSVGAA